MSLRAIAMMVERLIVAANAQLLRQLKLVRESSPIGRPMHAAVWIPQFLREIRLCCVGQDPGLHLWAQLENELGMGDMQANAHASMSTGALVDLFRDLEMKGTKSLSVNELLLNAIAISTGIRFPELMTLAEKFVLVGGRGEENVECTGKMCGHSGNLFVSE
jgi:hypothetical protein